MIQTKFTNKDGVIEITVKGHAGSAPIGEDLICAAASILFATAARYAKVMQDGERLQEPAKIVDTAGDALIRVKPIPAAMPLAMHTFSVIGLGFDNLRCSFPENVNFISFGKA